MPTHHPQPRPDATGRTRAGGRTKGDRATWQARPALAAAAVLATLAMAGCGGSSPSTSSTGAATPVTGQLPSGMPTPAATGGSVGTTTIPTTGSAQATLAPAAASGTGSSVPSAPPGGASAGATASATAPAAAKLTPQDTALAGLLGGVKVHTGALRVAPPAVVAQAKAQSASKASTADLARATVVPSSCKSATLADAALVTSRQPLAMYGTRSQLVTLRRMDSPAQAARMVDHARTMARACAKYSTTMTMNGQRTTIKATTTLWPINVPQADDAVAQKQAATTAGNQEMGQASSALGQVGDLLVQVTDRDGRSSAAQLQSDMSAIATVLRKKA